MIQIIKPCKCLFGQVLYGFRTITGIDNHKWCVTFGCGLLSSETIESYEWLLTEFKKTFEKEPIMLITDQCPSLKQAIPKVYPNVKHRLCMWHICNKFADKVRTLQEILVINTYILYMLLFYAYNFSIIIICFGCIAWFKFSQDWDSETVKRYCVG